VHRLQIAVDRGSISITRQTNVFDGGAIENEVETAGRDIYIKDIYLEER
jgi:hypothetical protein